MTPNDFVAQWRNYAGPELAAYQQHFLGLCALAGHATPMEADPERRFFSFEAGVTTTSGGHGRADVWYRDHFAIEYKAPGANLEHAYQQLLRYREALFNPPLLIVCDFHRLVVHTNFTNSVKRVITLALDDLLTPAGLAVLRDIFYNPQAFRSEQTAEQVTQHAAAQFARLAEHLRSRGRRPAETAHFLIRLLFCLFAEDIGLLPAGLFTRLVTLGRANVATFNRQLELLFAAMAVGDAFGEHSISYINGGLFEDGHTVELDAEAIRILREVTEMDWSAIQPSILGTLFERSLDPGKRAALGAHYTGEGDILLIVEPVLMAPLRRRWAEVQEQARELAARRGRAANRAAYTRFQNELQALIQGFVTELRGVRVLDPACGSGNFLYVALRLLLDLEKQVNSFTGEVGVQPFFPGVSPEQIYGIELNEYAHELAQATVWIGYLQWLHENGYGFPSEPILKALDNIRQMDAILAYDEAGNPVEPEWPAAEVIVGNPPFLGDRRMREELGDLYVDELRRLYHERITGVVDLVCYWFTRSTDLISSGAVKRVGLLATNSIRHGDSRQVLKEINRIGGIFMAWSDRPWIQDGAAVRVSMVGFDDGSEQERVLDGEPVAYIYSDLSAAIDITGARVLAENRGIAFSGTKKYGPFEIEPAIAQQMLYDESNGGWPNADVLKPWVNGRDIAGRPRGLWIIDFGERSEQESARYHRPFEYVQRTVKPTRETVRNPRLRDEWWLFESRRPALFKAVKNLDRFIVTPAVSRHRIFVWLKPQVQPDQQLIVFARSDDYFFGVLHSKIHEKWVLRRGARLGVGNDPRYNATETFATFPFPWPPGKEPAADPRVEAVAAAARALVAARDAWLNPPGLPEAELRRRTLTNLYNERPAWLAALHAALDAAVAAAYGWPADLPNEDVLGRLLALNLKRAGEAVRPPLLSDT